jgi:pSer/pThr/pTyr-binding forkhead associated (FHA) protein
MRLSLEITSGPLTGKRIVAEVGQVVRIGRTTKADFATEDAFMSGEHFAIEGDRKAWRIRDLKSRNGTKVNGEVVTSAEVREGDRVHAGSTDFIVRIEGDLPDPSRPRSKKLLVTLPPGIPAPDPPAAAASLTQDKKGTSEVSDPSLPQPAKVGSGRIKRETSKGTRPVANDQSPDTSRVVEPLPSDVPPKSEPLAEAVRVKPPKVARESSNALQSYEAATPGGRLLRLLQTQPEPLLALLDATHETRVLKLMQESGEHFESLYQDPNNASIAPYLVRLPPESNLLRQMVYEGWGHGWGIYLTCPLSLTQLRGYFRRELMVKLPDGVELFSRFYDPRFFRAFLNSCSAAEAERFFGPVSSYFIEAEKPEIVLQFTRTTVGVEKKGHLLSEL